MAEIILDVFDAHKSVYRTVKKFSPQLITFMRYVTDNYATHLVPSNGVPLDDDYIDRFIEKNQNLSSVALRAIVTSLRMRVKELFNEDAARFSQYVEIRCVASKIIIEFSQPEPPKDRLALDFDVPWGAPPGTIRVKHLDEVPLGAFRYLWCDDESPCDIILGDDIFIIEYGLYSLESGELRKHDLADVGRRVEVPKFRAPKTPVMGDIGKVKICSVETPDTRPYKDGVMADIYWSGDFSGVYLDYVNVHISDKENTPNELSITINNINFLITEPGIYMFSDGELTEVKEENDETGDS